MKQYDFSGELVLNVLEYTFYRIGTWFLASAAFLLGALAGLNHPENDPRWLVFSAATLGIFFYFIAIVRTVDDLILRPEKNRKRFDEFIKKQKVKK